MEHTPGPWFIEKILFGSGWHFRLGIASFRDQQEAEANARLITVAPDLLEACELAETTIERFNRHNSTNGTLDVIRAALDKATVKC